VFISWLVSIGCLRSYCQSIRSTSIALLYIPSLDGGLHAKNQSNQSFLRKRARDDRLPLPNTAHSP
jgi:hypothetical protein